MFLFCSIVTKGKNMTIENARDWATEFESTELSALMDMLSPDDLSEEEAENWQAAWNSAFQAKIAAKKAREEAQASDARAHPQSEAAKLLEKQIASSAALIDYLTVYVSSAKTDPHICMSFMDRMSNMLRASANVGKVVSQLRGQISRSEQAIEVAYRGRGWG
jgi:hypothetical protein